MGDDGLRLSSEDLSINNDWNEVAMASLALSTQHAKIRMQQRAIPGCVIDWLIRYGNRERALNDASLVYFDKRSRRRLMDENWRKGDGKDVMPSERLFDRAW